MREIILRLDIDKNYLYSIIRMGTRNFLLEQHRIESWVLVFMILTCSSLTQRKHLSRILCFLVFPLADISYNFLEEAKRRKLNSCKNNQVHCPLNWCSFVQWQEARCLAVLQAFVDLILMWYRNLFWEGHLQTQDGTSLRKLIWSLASLLKLQTMTIYCQLWGWQR